MSGPIDTVGTTYVVHFGPVKSPTEILEVERPRRFATKFGSWVLRGRSSATFEPDGDGTRITQEFETVGRISAISAWIFSRGSYEGSFRGELEKFARIAEREAPQADDRGSAPRLAPSTAIRWADATTDGSHSRVETMRRPDGSTAVRVDQFALWILQALLRAIRRLIHPQDE